VLARLPDQPAKRIHELCLGTGILRTPLTPPERNQPSARGDQTKSLSVSRTRIFRWSQGGVGAAFGCRLIFAVFIPATTGF
jgi:hypothetical protein